MMNSLHTLTVLDTTPRNGSSSEANLSSEDDPQPDFLPWCTVQPGLHSKELVVIPCEVMQ